MIKNLKFLANARGATFVVGRRTVINRNTEFSTSAISRYSICYCHTVQRNAQLRVIQIQQDEKRPACRCEKKIRAAV